jgi:phosphoribosyl-AMP cyclohydrolase
MTEPAKFAPPGDKKALEEGPQLTPRFNDQGLVPAIATDEASGDVLMLAWMNAEALLATITTRQATYYSRSRRELWIKGATSGHTQKVIDIRIDCDQDAIWLKVEQAGAACHTGKASCFYRSVKQDGTLQQVD